MESTTMFDIQITTHKNNKDQDTISKYVSVGADELKKIANGFFAQGTDMGGLDGFLPLTGPIKEDGTNDYIHFLGENEDDYLSVVKQVIKAELE